MPFGQIHQSPLEGNDRSLQDLGFVAQVEAKIESDLIIAAARRVQLGPGPSNPPRELRLDIHVHVLELRIKHKAAVVDLFLDRAQGALDLSELVRRQNSCFLQRPRMSDAAANVLTVESPVERH